MAVLAWWAKREGNHTRREGNLLVRGRMCPRKEERGGYQHINKKASMDILSPSTTSSAPYHFLDFSFTCLLDQNPGRKGTLLREERRKILINERREIQLVRGKIERDI